MYVRPFSFVYNFANFTTAIMRETVSSIGRALAQTRGCGFESRTVSLIVLQKTLKGDEGNGTTGKKLKKVSKKECIDYFNLHWGSWRYSYNCDGSEGYSKGNAAN